MLPRAGDLVGLKVSHDFEELAEGDGRILTLKDSRILDDEGSVLLSEGFYLLTVIFCRGRLAERRASRGGTHTEEQRVENQAT